jgi:ElaB/YqjD/DUF883 family membrane-anchored ribosome-binding protein
MIRDEINKTTQQYNQLQSKVRDQIKQYCDGILSTPKNREKLLISIQKVHAGLLKKNEDLGKEGSEAAKKRLLDAKKRNQEKMKEELSFIVENQDNACNATRLYYLLNPMEKIRASIDKKNIMNNASAMI